MKNKKRLTIILLAGLGLLVTGLVAVALFINGLILVQNPSLEEYPVRGVDVSNYQGEIDWEVLGAQGIHFAFIKATEGSGYVDPRFADNLQGALQTKLRVGAYHFFSYDSSGATQAQNFIANVPVVEGMLPPVIDVEFYGDKQINLPKKDEVERELLAMIELLEEHYGMRPILYTTQKAYRLYIETLPYPCDLWMRNILTKPSVAKGSNWIFWQYTDKETLEGYAGQEKFIDMNVFNGTVEEFERYAR